MPEEINFNTDHLAQICDHESRLKRLEDNTDILSDLRDNVVRLTTIQEQSNTNMELIQHDMKELRENSDQQFTEVKNDISLLKNVNDLKKQKWAFLGTSIAAFIAAIGAIITALLS